MPDPLARMITDVAVIAVVDQRKWGLLRELLVAACEPISYLDRGLVYTRPEDAPFAYDARVRRLVQRGAPSVRVWGEFPVFTSREQADPWIAYEAILNRAFAHQPVQLVCGYDAREHSEAVLEGARHTHPLVLEGAWLDIPNSRARTDPGRRRAARPAPAAAPRRRGRVPAHAPARDDRRWRAGARGTQPARGRR
jgi:DcmR-like sensory protein